MAEYAYDGQKWRTVAKSYTGGSLTETRHFYYTRQWQAVEERLGSSSDADRQFVWGLRYIDDLVLRDRDTNANRTLDERLYALQDPNWNVLALADTSGDTQERYLYEAYGQASLFTGGYANRGASLYGWETRFTGYRWDAVSALMHVRNRDLHVTLGRWLSRDPLRATREHAYRYVSNGPLSLLDPEGLLEVSLSKMMNPWFIATCTKDPVSIAKFLFEFKLSKPSPCDGFFFQHVTMEVYKTDCKTCCTKPETDWEFHRHRRKVLTKSYYEWFGMKGLPPKGLVTKGETAMSPLDNAFLVDERRIGKKDLLPSCGMVRWKAEVRFYCKMDVPMGSEKRGDGRTPPVVVAEYPNQFPKTEVRESGTIPSRSEKPDFWGKAPVESLPWTTSVLWDCCEKRDKVTAAWSMGPAPKGKNSN